MVCDEMALELYDHPNTQNSSLNMRKTSKNPQRGASYNIPKHFSPKLSRSSKAKESLRKYHSQKDPKVM
jgi:hypothetical protein